MTCGIILVDEASYCLGANASIIVIAVQGMAVKAVRPTKESNRGHT